MESYLRMWGGPIWTFDLLLVLFKKIVKINNCKGLSSHCNITTLKLE